MFSIQQLAVLPQTILMSMLRGVTTVVRAPLSLRIVRRRPRLLSLSRCHCARSPGASTTSRGPQKETTSASLELLRPAVLDRPPLVLVGLEAGAGHCPTRYRGGLAW